MKQLNWYQIFGNTHKIPDGRTVTPTDDIQIWLNCADIWDKTYTTLAEVLADTDTLLALISSNNAVDYMVRSTTWAVAQSLVPVMTSNTTPSGECSTNSSYGGGYEAYKAFDNNVSTQWVAVTSAGAGTYLRYHFPQPTNCVSAFLKHYNNSVTRPKYKIQASNDGLTWVDVTSEITAPVSDAAEETVALNTNGLYSDYQVYFTYKTSSSAVGLTTLQFYSTSITDSADAMTYIGLNNYASNTLLADPTWCNAICNSEYWNSVLNASVPTMTSNTTPSGTASTDSIYNTNYDAWKAFNGIDNINYGWCPADSGSHWVQYDFETPVCVKKIQYRGFTYGTDVNAVLRGSTDNVTFTDIFNIPNPGSATNNIMSADIFSNNDKYRYIRVNHVGSNGSGYRFQFYGRKDV